MNPIYIHHFDTHNQYETYNNDENKIQFPHASYTEEDELVRYNDRIDYSKEYLTFESTTPGNYIYLYISFALKGNANLVGSSSVINRINEESSDIVISYQIDDNQNWIDCHPPLLLESKSISPYTEIYGKKIRFKGNNTHLNGSDWYLRILPSRNAIVYGNILSIISAEGFGNLTSVPSSVSFYGLFSAIDDEKSSTIYSTYAKYLYMDKNKKLILPLLHLTPGCYESLFNNRFNIKYVPKLPAMDINSRCYSNMFYGCTGITEAPQLPAKSLKPNCYEKMFFECGNLKYIDCAAIDISATNCLSEWVYGVGDNGTFIKNIFADWLFVGQNGVPQNWTVIYK